MRPNKNIWIRITDSNNMKRLVNVSSITQVWSTIGNNTVIQIGDNGKENKIQIAEDFIDELSVLLSSTKNNIVYELKKGKE